MNEAFLDTEEQELMETLEQDGWQPVANLDEWKTRLSNTAAQIDGHKSQSDGRGYALSDTHPQYPAQIPERAAG
jgi:hypothetical protein